MLKSIMEQEEVKRTIAKLVEKFKKLTPQQIKNYTEAETCKEFILPFFAALGWNTESKNEVSAEEHTSAKDRSDYGFYLNGWPKFYLEAKKLSSDIDNEKFAKQATGYSWNKGITWAILTNFETLLVFNAQDISEHLSHRIFLRINFDEYLDKFDKLLWLTKNAFEKNILDKEAESVGKKLQRVSVTDTLYKDLNKSREELLKSFHEWNTDVPYGLLEEGIQKFLDRLIFTRVAEDRGLERPTLVPLIRKFGGSANDEFYRALISKFRELDSVYNSNLFAPHPLETWSEYDNSTKKVIERLHGKTGYYEYNFEAIPADILGSVYENYLGYKLSQSEKGVAVSKDAKKRKEQGIYYTPTYIVDYIVSNALKPILDNCNKVEDLKEIKVLDPACGSGSFLIKAMEVIANKYKEFGRKDDESTRIQILTENIFGVDLDEQAVEIAILNLLINSLDKRMKLPNLAGNIKNGNSLISGTDKELVKVFGKGIRDKKPFNWEQQFPEVYNRENPGFDIIIGNPPYVGSRELDQESKAYFSNVYIVAKDQYDLYTLFIEKSLNLLRKRGRLSFIVPNKFLITRYGYQLRKIIAESTEMTTFRDYSKENVFKDASVYPVVVGLTKRNRPQKLEDSPKDYDVLKIFGYIKENEIIHKLEASRNYMTIKAWRPLAESTKIIKGKHVIISNREIDRYTLQTDQSGDLSKKRDVDVIKNKIIMKKLCYNLAAALDEEGYYPINTTYCVTASNKHETKYILGILNSKLMSYYVREKYSDTALRGGYIELRIFQIKSLPIIKASTQDINIINDLVNKILELRKLQSTEVENSNNWSRLHLQIEDIDNQIDRQVYKIYQLTPEEVKIVENIHKQKG